VAGVTGGVVVELGDGTTTLDEDSRRPAMRSASVAAVPDDARHLLVLLRPVEEEER
jgi:hypothetical protein